MVTNTQEREFDYSAADFESVRRILYKKSGINLTESKKQLVYSRLARRLRALKLETFTQYLAYLDKHDNELEEFINALTTNLTAFFREAHHFDILAEFAKKIKDQRRTLRVWCAASSTGEEPYSIAMALAEAYGTYEPPVEIIASDIDSNVLREASAGIYTAQRLESVSLDRKKQFFQRGKGANNGFARVIPELKKCIEFKQLNLLDAAWSVKPAFDVIFCRNVMIYFDKDTQLKLLERMTTLMHPQGLYIAGHSESFTQAAHLVKLVDKTTYVLASNSAHEKHKGKRV
jgi:chemotaxis protein methyltransferase CheR